MPSSMLDRKLPLWAIFAIIVIMLGPLAFAYRASETDPIDKGAASSSRNTEAITCGVSKIAIGGLDAHGEYDYLIVSGTLTNGCDTPVRNVRLRFIVLKRDGTATYAEDFYAAPVGALIGGRAQYQFQLTTKLGMDLSNRTYRIEAVAVSR